MGPPLHSYNTALHGTALLHCIDADVVCCIIQSLVYFSLIKLIYFTLDDKSIFHKYHNNCNNYKKIEPSLNNQYILLKITLIWLYRALYQFREENEGSLPTPGDFTQSKIVLDYADKINSSTTGMLFICF